MCRKPLGRFLSFDVKRSLFSGKRLAEHMKDADDSPATKRLREAEIAINNICLKVCLCCLFIMHKQILYWLWLAN